MQDFFEKKECLFFTRSPSGCSRTLTGKTLFREEFRYTHKQVCTENRLFGNDIPFFIHSAEGRQIHGKTGKKLTGNTFRPAGGCSLGNHGYLSGSGSSRRRPCIHRCRTNFYRRFRPAVHRYYAEVLLGRRKMGVPSHCHSGPRHCIIPALLFHRRFKDGRCGGDSCDYRKFSRHFRCPGVPLSR